MVQCSCLTVFHKWVITTLMNYILSTTWGGTARQQCDDALPAYTWAMHRHKNDEPSAELLHKIFPCMFWNVSKHDEPPKNQYHKICKWSDNLCGSRNMRIKKRRFCESSSFNCMTSRACLLPSCAGYDSCCRSPIVSWWHWGVVMISELIIAATLVINGFAVLNFKLCVPVKISVLLSKRSWYTSISYTSGLLSKPSTFKRCWRNYLCQNNPHS